LSLQNKFVMRIKPNLVSLLKDIGSHETIIELYKSLASLLPNDVSFESDVWNLHAWVTRKGSSKSYNIYFDKFKNEELRIVIKIYFLNRRRELMLAPESMQAISYALEYLDKALQAMPLSRISNRIFEDAAELITNEVKRTSVSRTIDYLVVFGDWLLLEFGFRISFANNSISYYQHGRKATDEERDAKLIDSRIIAELINCRHRTDLNEKDQFYILIFVIFVGTGFRINELATLPKDCLVKEGENVGLRHFPLKKPKIAVKWLHKDWAVAVEDAINKLISITENGRKIVSELRVNPGLDWSAIVKDDGAIQYFVAKFCHEWTKNPLHDMFYKDGVWFEKEKRYIDIVGLINQAGSQKKLSYQYDMSRRTVAYLLKAYQAAQNNMLPPTNSGDSRTSWDTDSRVISILQLEKYCNLALKKNLRQRFDSIIYDARENYQLKGMVYPCPAYNETLENKYRRVINPVVQSISGKPLLQPEDTLLVSAKYQFSQSRGTKINDYKLITDRDISFWFCGINRSYGTKNDEDSCFSRFDILDPKTGKIAKFTSHDIRHWLSTYYHEGGMPSDQVAMLMNRTDKQNDTYDQTSSKTRLNNMREAIRNGNAIGHVSDVYHNIAISSRVEAESYLEAATLQFSIMPHGGCSLNLTLPSCNNHNGCFNGSDGLCENLCIDLNNEDTKIELERLYNESSRALSILPEDFPQYLHYRNINRNLSGLLGVDNE